jgi:hypothetical protein
MPPRRSARVAAVAERESCALPLLPPSVVLAIFSVLPVDARLRCKEVCRGWRAVLRERSLWLRLDLSEASGGLALPATDALLRAAAARAGGQMQSLNVTEGPGITREALMAVLTANAGSLRELRLWRGDFSFLGLADAESLLRAAPQLRLFQADVACEGVADAQRLLRNEGAFAPLHLRKLHVTFDTQTEASVLSLATDVVAHVSLPDLHLYGAPLDTPAALDATVAVALAKRLNVLALVNCGLSPASAPALARLLGSDALRSLLLMNGDAPLLDAAAAEVFGNALRANSTLDKLFLMHTAPWREPGVAVTLLGAVTAHRSLRALDLSDNLVGDAQQEAAGAALGALIAADSPALLIVNMRGCGLREAALGPLLDALPGNTHLEKLLLGEVTASAEFLRERLLPAVRANTSLRRFKIAVTGEGEGAAREVQEILKNRTAR